MLTAAGEDVGSRYDANDVRKSSVEENQYVACIQTEAWREDRKRDTHEYARIVEDVRLYMQKDIIRNRSAKGISKAETIREIA